MHIVVTLVRPSEPVDANRKIVASFTLRYPELTIWGILIEGPSGFEMSIPSFVYVGLTAKDRISQEVIEKYNLCMADHTPLQS